MTPSQQKELERIRRYIYPVHEDDVQWFDLSESVKESHVEELLSIIDSLQAELGLSKERERVFTDQIEVISEMRDEAIEDALLALKKKDPLTNATFINCKAHFNEPPQEKDPQ